MTNPLFWLGLSILLLAFSLLILVCVSIPTLLGLARASRSAEKLFDTLDRELPRTLEAMRHTGSDLSGLADDMTDGITSARNIAKQVDHGLSDVRQQASQAKRTTRSVVAGVRAAWRVLTKPQKKQKARTKRRPPVKRPPDSDRVPPPGRANVSDAPTHGLPTNAPTNAPAEPPADVSANTTASNDQ